MSGKLVQGNDGALEERAVRGHIAFIEGQGILGQDHIAIAGDGGRRHAGAIGLFLVGRALDTQLAVGVACELLVGLVALLDTDAGVIFFDLVLHSSKGLQ
jgi:hypothetical protein